VLLFLTGLTSCRPIYQNGQVLSKYNFQKLKGEFSNFKNDTSTNENSLWLHLNGLAPFGSYNAKVFVEPVDKRSISLKLISDDSVINSFIYKGRYTKGTFKLKSKLSHEFIFGPVFWTLKFSRKYLCLDENNNVIIEERNTGSLFFLALPLIPGGGKTDHKFNRRK
jgi:hypothetical protein